MNKFEEFKQIVTEAETSVFGEIKNLLGEAEEDASKFYENGNKSAGTRLRSNMQKIRKLIHHPSIRQVMKTVNEGAQDVRSNVNDLK
jgi:hypothetical protein